VNTGFVVNLEMMQVLNRRYSIPGKVYFCNLPSNFCNSAELALRGIMMFRARVFSPQRASKLT
jgi:hypothetical protein